MTRPRERLTAVVCEACRATTTKNWSRTCNRCTAAGGDKKGGHSQSSMRYDHAGRKIPSPCQKGAARGTGPKGGDR
jgi:hypothetical protein